jgi:uroporphyrinogen III methyltransferase/synthase
LTQPRTGGLLAGRRIVVTRRPDQSSALVRALRDRGAEVLEVPAIEVVPPEDTQPLDAALSSRGRYDWIAFTSANAVLAVRDRLGALGLPSLTASGPRIASLGPSTTAAVRAAFPDGAVALEPAAAFRAAGLVEAFAGVGGAGARVLVPASSRARDELPLGLRKLGFEVEVVEAYRTVEPPQLAESVSRCLEQGFDAVAFASPSAVEGFAGAAGSRARGLAAAVIGPSTEAVARAAGFDVRAVAHPSTAEGLVEALERLWPHT